MTDEFELVALQTLNNTELRYLVPLKKDIQHPTNIDSVEMRTDKPVNNVNFSLSGKGETGTINFKAVSTVASGAFQTDRSLGTLQDLIDNVSSSKADQLRARFGQNGSGDYVVRTIEEQEIWLREYVHNPGATSTWTLFGPSYSYRTVDSNNNPTGTPIFVNDADIEPNPVNPAVGSGVIKFTVGGRL